jgi:hypothetical protein
VVALDARHPQIPNDVQAFLGIGIITDHIAQAGIVRAVLLLDVLKDNIERIQIGVYIGYDRKLHVLPCYFKPAKLVSGLTPDHIFVPDKTIQSGFPDALPKRFQLGFGAFRHQLHPPIRQILHHSGHLETGCYGPHTVAKTNPLDAPGIEYLHSLAVHYLRPFAAKPGQVGQNASNLPASIAR